MEFVESDNDDSNYDSNDNLWDNEELYKDRVTFVSDQLSCLSSKESFDANLILKNQKQINNENSSTSPSILRPTPPNNDKEIQPLTLNIPPLNTASLSSGTILETLSDKETNKQETLKEVELLIEKNIELEKDEKFNFETLSAELNDTPIKKQIVNIEKKTNNQPVIMEDLINKEIKSLEIPKNIRSKMPYSFNNHSKLISPYIEELDCEKFAIKYSPLPKEDKTSKNISSPKFASTPANFDLSNSVILNFPEFFGKNTTKENLVNSLRTIIDEIHYAKKNLSMIQKKYFDKQVAMMEEGWQKYDEEVLEFKKQKAEEYQKIAEIRSKLENEIKRKTAKEDTKLVKELQKENEKLKAKDMTRTRLISELRLKLKCAEDTIKVHKEVADQRLSQISQLQTTLTKAQQENSNLRVKYTRAKLQKNEILDNQKNDNINVLNQALIGTKNVAELGRTKASLLNKSLTNSNVPILQRNNALYQSNLKSILLNKTVRFANPLTTSHSFTNINNYSNFFTVPGFPKRNIIAGMLNTKYEIKEFGYEYTFSNGPHTVICIELKCGCRLYKSNNGDFTWVFKNLEKLVKLRYYAFTKTFEILTPAEHCFRLFSNKQFEIFWRNGDHTLITPEGKRIEMYLPIILNESVNEEIIVKYEMFINNLCICWDTVSDPEEFFAETKREGKRGNDFYCSISENQTYSINTKDFMMRRVNEDGFTKIVFNEILLQLSVCLIDNIFIAKHIIQHENKKEKRDCYASGSCLHVSRN